MNNYCPPTCCLGTATVLPAPLFHDSVWWGEKNSYLISHFSLPVSFRVQVQENWLSHFFLLEQQQGKKKKKDPVKPQGKGGNSMSQRSLSRIHTHTHRRSPHPHRSREKAAIWWSWRRGKISHPTTQPQETTKSPRQSNPCGGAPGMCHNLFLDSQGCTSFCWGDPHWS